MSRLIIRILERNETSTNDVGAALDSVDHNLQWAWIRRDQSFVQGETTASALSTQLAPLIEAESDINSITVVIPSEQVLMLFAVCPAAIVDRSVRRCLMPLKSMWLLILKRCI